MENYCSEKKNRIDESNMWAMLGTAMNCGVPILISIAITGENFPAYRDVMNNASRVIKTGENFSTSLLNFKGSLDSIVLTLAKEGDKKGELPANLLEGAGIIKTNLRLTQQDPRRYKGFPDFKEQPYLIEPKVPRWAERLRASNQDRLEINEISDVVEAAELEAGLKAGALYGIYTRPQINQIMFYDLLSRTLKSMPQELAITLLADNNITDYPLSYALKEIGDELKRKPTELDLFRELEKHKNQFSDFETQVLRMGEIGGVLDEISRRLSSYFKESYELINTAKLVDFKA
jgi:hypothetical protein